MQREIKFRAWDKVRKEYLSGGQVLIAILKGNRPKSNPVYLDILKDADMYKDRFVLEQFTGLHDKNGKEIYEGDIIEYGGQQYLDVFRALIKYKDDRFIADWHCDVFFRKDVHFWTTERKVQVIGNIYSNPELLKEDAQ